MAAILASGKIENARPPKISLRGCSRPLQNVMLVSQSEQLRHISAGLQPLPTSCFHPNGLSLFFSSLFHKCTHFPFLSIPSHLFSYALVPSFLSNLTPHFPLFSLPSSFLSIHSVQKAVKGSNPTIVDCTKYTSTYLPYFFKIIMCLF